MASFYLDGDALEWCRLLLQNKQLIRWKNFAEKAKVHFKPKGLESAKGRVAKLRQVTTISELQGHFEAIDNETDDISDGLMVRLFVSGLREDIKNSVLCHEPKTYDDTLKCAHIHERHIQAKKGTNQPAFANRATPLLPNSNQHSSTWFVPSPTRMMTSTVNRHHSNALPILRFRVGVSVDYATIVMKNTLQAISVRLRLSYCF